MTKPFEIKDYVIMAMVAVALAFATYIVLSPEGIRDAPQLDLKALSGDPVKVGGKQQRPMLVTFWSTSCTTCIAEMPHLKDMYGDLRSGGFEILGVAMYYDKPVDVYELVKRRNIPYPIYTDVNKKVVKAFELKTMVTPTTFLISPNGRIVYQKVGKFDADLLRRKITYYIKQKNKATGH
jgi:peroxiredoxin